MDSIDSLVTTSLEKDVGIIPAPVFNPAFGAGIAVLPVFIYRPKGFHPETKPSTSQGIIYFNFTGRWLAGLKQTLYLNRNRFWIDAFAAYASMNFKLYNNITASKDDYREIKFEGFVSNLSFLVLARRHFYIGPIFSSNYLKQEEVGVSQPYQNEYHWYHTPGIKLSHDSRDDIFYPIEGWFSTLSFESLLPSKSYSYDFNKITAGISTYQKLDGNGDKIIASRLYTQLGIGDLPLHEMASPGASPILRGYITGHYLNSSIISLQSEYRWMFSDRWGTVGFLGYGWLFDQPNQIKENLGLYSIGAGIRYRFFQKFKINLALDVAFGRNSANVYFSLSESF
ncbi:BamA/TamA family outer membrane protein [Carboxylicivirga sp. N1Y90]|uniref:BamA/TamA family outer membrane protein n=1 Tax=Carboxylicivirga fragile TaxID=3417571 RepID=UPI003D356485|nr:BamA/TamA family outer membrane protein [Marinilabiliaceae bacterium N1Y90]